MRLDRNVNFDGRGKYALINLRTNKVEWGGTDADDFWVMKLKDRFAAPALLTYASAVESYAKELRMKAKVSISAVANELISEAFEWEEYAVEVRELAKWSEKNPHSKLPD